MAQNPSSTVSKTPKRGDLERPLPHNTDAERSILGAITLDNNYLTAVVKVLKAADFFLPQHRSIFEAMIALDVDGKPIDTITLMEQLQTFGQLEAAGDVSYLSQLADGLPRVTNVEHYARIVKEKAALRTLIYTASAIQEQALAAGDEVGVILARASDSLTALRSSSGLATEPAGWREVFDSYADFETSPELSFSIGGFLQNDGATMIGGLSGHGKTLILCSIAKALLSGQGSRLWGLFPVLEKCTRVLYLIPESSRGPFKHRLKLFGIYDALNTERDGRLLVRTLSAGPAPRLDDPRILYAAKHAHVILDTATRFIEGDEKSAGDNNRGLATDIFALLAAGARSVIAAHHSPKAFAGENVMRLENVLRGTGDVGAMLTTAWAIKQIDADQNIIHVENVKARDFEPGAPFQLIGRPFITNEGDFRVHKQPGECGVLADEHTPERNRGGGATDEAREAKASRLALLRRFLAEKPAATSAELVEMFKTEGIKVSGSAIRNYKREM